MVRYRYSFIFPLIYVRSPAEVFNFVNAISQYSICNVYYVIIYLSGRLQTLSKVNTFKFLGS